MSKEKAGRANGRGFKLNIGIIIFMCILAYFVIRILMSASSRSISITDVEKGYIVENTYYNGVIIRDEELITTNDAGNVYYYLPSGDKAARQQAVYVLDRSGALSSVTEDSMKSVDSTIEYGDIREMMSSYQGHARDSRYDELYSLRFEIENKVNSAITHTVMNSEEIKKAIGQSNCITSRTDKSGIVSYTYDTYTGLAVDQITPEIFERKGYEQKSIESGSEVKKGDTVYRLTQNDSWSIIIKLTDQQKTSLQGRTTVSVRFRRDDISTYADFSEFERNGVWYGKLDLSKYMIKYINSRYLDIEIRTASEQGLKIPTSSLVTKDFYKISNTYIMSDPTDGNDYVINLSSGEDADKTAVTVYYRDEQYSYVDKNDLGEGDHLGYPTGTGNDFVVGETAPLTGVYCINRGYAAFRLVTVLYQTDVYTIVAENQEYGLSLYDRIVINAGEVKESQLVDNFTGED